MQLKPRSASWERIEELSAVSYQLLAFSFQLSRLQNAGMATRCGCCRLQLTS